MLQGKIAAIIDTESVVINLGSDKGVFPGMRFAAVYEVQRIPDPEDPTKTLGSLTFEIAKLQATNVQEKMTYCKVLDPYINKGLSIPIPISLVTTESKIDPAERQLGGPENLKLRIGTIVQQSSAQSSAKQ